MKEHYIIEFLNCKKDFKKDIMQFQGPQAYEKAVKWGKKNLENFNPDMIKLIHPEQDL
jgi:hypothetical protein